MLAVSFSSRKSVKDHTVTFCFWFLVHRGLSTYDFIVQARQTIPNTSSDSEIAAKPPKLKPCKVHVRRHFCVMLKYVQYEHVGWVNIQLFNNTFCKLQSSKIAQNTTESVGNGRLVQSKITLIFYTFFIRKLWLSSQSVAHLKFDFQGYIWLIICIWLLLLFYSIEMRSGSLLQECKIEMTDKTNLNT